MSAGREESHYLLEGPDWSGKSTQHHLLTAPDISRRLGRSVVGVREPGGTPIGQELRRIILDSELTCSTRTQFGLFTLDRRELADQVIRPALLGGAVVIGDRSWPSSVAYQGRGFGGDIDFDYILEESERAMGDCFMPDAVVILDISPEVRRMRRDARQGEPDRCEARQDEFYEGVRRGYQWLAAQHPDRFHIVDGSLPEDQVQREVISRLGLSALLN